MRAGAHLDSGSNAAASTGVTLTGGAAHTKGTAVDLINPLTIPAGWVCVETWVAGSSALIDIGIGGNIIIPNLIAMSSTAKDMAYSYSFPLFIPEGAIIEGSCQTVGASGAARVALRTYAPGRGMPRFGSIIETVGADTGNTVGTSFNPGATIHTDGAWSQLIAATAYPWRYCNLAIEGRNNLALTDASWLIDFGVGAAGQEVVHSGRMLLHVGSSADNGFQMVYHFPVNIPEGSRLAVRARSSTADATDRVLGAIAYGSVG